MLIKELIRKSFAVDYAKLFYYMYKREKKQIHHPMMKPGAVIDFLLRNSREIFQILIKKKFVILQVEIALTTRCSLRCRDCSNLMQYYQNPCDVDVKRNIRAISRICEAADHIMYFHVLGGEPFLYKDLAVVLKFMAARPEIGEIVVFTNGTLIPSDDVVAVLRKRKFRVVISCYGKLSRKTGELEQLLSDHHIRYQINKEEFYWETHGDVSPRNRSSRELKRQFLECSTLCRSIFNGELHYCPRSGHASDLGFITPQRQEYVDLSDESVSIDKLRKMLMSFFYCRRKYITACKYCDKGSRCVKKVTPGIQMKGCKETYEKNHI